MAKATTKAASNEIAPTKKSKNKITVNLTQLGLDDDETLALLAAVQKAASAKLKEKKTKKITLSPVSTKGVVRAASDSATVTVDIRNTEPGRSNIRLEHNGVKKQISEGDNVSFDNVQQGDTIWVEGHSLGTVKLTINRKARPQQKSFAPLDIIAFDFEIL